MTKQVYQFKFPGNDLIEGAPISTISAVGDSETTVRQVVANQLEINYNVMVEPENLELLRTEPEIEHYPS